MTHIDSIHSSNSPEWFTPKIYVEAVRKVLRIIDLDPASCQKAQATIKADRYMTLTDNGLEHPWYRRVFVNPPYGKTGSQSNQAIWSRKMVQEYEAGNLTEGILLVNAQTAEKWFQPLWHYAICFTDHRIKFVSPVGESKQPTHGNAFVYFGPHTDLFGEIFSQFGRIVEPK